MLKMKKPLGLLAAVAISAAMLSTAFTASAAENLFPRGDMEDAPELFENGDHGHMDLGEWCAWSSLSDSTAQGNANIFAVDKTVKHGGEQSLRIKNTEPGANSTYSIYTNAIQPGVEYTITWWVKTMEISGGMGASVNVVYYKEIAGDMRELTQAEGEILTEDTDWKQYSMTFTAPASFDRVGIKLQLWNMQGTAWFDDVVLIQGKPETTAPPTEPTDPADPGEPTDPADPGEPTDPGQPTTPTSPAAPGVQIQVVEPVTDEPVLVFQPGDPAPGGDSASGGSTSGNMVLFIVLAAVGGLVVGAGVMLGVGLLLRARKKDPGSPA